jgi:aldehyde dehydrogenase
MTIVEEGVSSVYAAPASAAPSPNTVRGTALHRRRVRRADQGPVLREHHARHRQAVHRGGSRHREDIDRAVDVAWKAFESWKRTTPADRANILNKIADRMEANLEKIAVAETWENGKPVRETLAADIPLAIDHFRYFAGVLRAQEGTLSQIDEDTVAYHFHEPLGWSARSSRGTSRS